MAYKNKGQQKESAHKHYLLNKEKIKERAVEFKQLARKRNREYVDEFLKQNPCVDCGENDVVVLEFDHVRGVKKIEVTVAINRGWSFKKNSRRN